MLYLPGSRPRGSIRDVAVVFPGDISDLRDEMTECADYCLEDVARRVRRRVPPDQDVAVVRPAVSPHGHFAHYTFFLGGMGHYMHARAEVLPKEGDTTACKHLICLLTSLKEKEGAGGYRRVSLVGFSKGCTVLTRMVERPDPLLWSAVRAVYFVDSGLDHEGAFPSPEAVTRLQAGCRAAAHHAVAFHLSATDRQVCDPARPHIGAEFDAFPAATKVRHPGTSLADHFALLYNLEWVEEPDSRPPSPGPHAPA